VAVDVRRLVVAVTVPFVIASALVADVSSAQPDPPADTDAASLAAGFDDASPYPPISRLGRWDGTSYVTVEPGSIDTDEVVVISHGWEPGLQSAYDAAQAESSTLVPVWDPRLDSSEFGSPIRTIGPLAEALARAAPDSTVLLYSWIDQSATPLDLFDASVGENATEINGHRLAVALDQALSDGWDGELHLIGHSFGSNIVTTAALALHAPLRQLTLMDSPDDELVLLGGAANDLRYKLPRLEIGRTTATVFVDNYISLVGIPYGQLPGLEQVVDVQLRPPDGGFSVEHEYPLAWSTDVLNTGSTAPRIGPWWSPLLGGDPAIVGSSYVQPASDQPLALTEQAAAPAGGVAGDLAWTVVPLELATGGSGVTVGETADAVEIALPTTEDALLLEFAVAFDGPADAATLDLAVDGRVRYTAVGPDDGTGAPGAMVLLWDVEPGEHTLTATLTGGAEGATATLSNLRVVEAEGIVRNLDQQQTTELVELLAAGAVVLVLAVLVGVGYFVYRLIRWRRRPARVADRSLG